MVEKEKKKPSEELNIIIVESLKPLTQNYESFLSIFMFRMHFLQHNRPKPAIVHENSQVQNLPFCWKCIINFNAFHSLVVRVVIPFFSFFFVD